MAGSGRVEVQREESVLTLLLANEGRANAVDEPMLDALAWHLRDGAAGPPRAVVLAGAGERHFSAGLDLSDRGPAGVRDGEQALARAVAALRETPAPVVCVLNGDAFGGALELAMACDWRIARRGARFAMTPARLGVVYAPDGLAAFVRAIGPAHAAELFATARPIDADRAAAIGLVNHVLEPEALWSAALDAARAVAANAPIAVAGTLALLRRPDDTELAQAWRERAFASADLAEGLAAFRERRPPRFSGR